MPGLETLADTKSDVKVEGAANKVEDLDENASMALTLAAEGGDLNVNRVYKWSEACEICETYSRMMVKMTADPNNWFALYRLRKIRYANFGITAMTRGYINDARFESLEAVIEFVEKLLESMGYEFIRRDNFEVIATLHPDQMLTDVHYMVSLLMAAYEWECSIHFHKSKAEEYGPPKYMIVDDGVYTPQTFAMKREGGVGAFDQAGADMDTLMQTVEDQLKKRSRKAKVDVAQVQKKLNFDDMSSSTSSPARPQGVSSQPTVAQGLMGLVSAGKISVEEMASLLSAMKAEKPSHEERRERELTQEEQDLLSRDKPQMPVRNDRYVTTVLQNVQIRTFDGQRRSAEEARQWISKFLHNANLSNWDPQQRLEVFSNQLVGPMNYWLKQLPVEVKRSWKSVLEAFIARYGTDNTPARLRYYKLTQKSDESIVNYLYRLNAAAQAAGLDYRQSTTDFQEHVQQFFDSSLEKSLPLPFKIRQYSSIDEVEDVLVQYESSQARTARKPVQISGPMTKAKSEERTAAPRVNAVNADNGQHHDSQPSYGSQGSSQPRNDDSRPKCSECGRRGHEAQACYRRMTCDFCHRTGHPAEYCRLLVEKFEEVRRKYRAGELTAEEVAEQLNQ